MCFINLTFSKLLAEIRWRFVTANRTQIFIAGIVLKLKKIVF